MTSHGLMKAFYIASLLLFGLAGTAHAQTSCLGLTPGASMRRDVEKTLGAPVRTAGRLAEYSAPPESGATSLLVQYAAGSSLVERIEANFPDPVDRAALLASLGIATPPRASKTDAGKLVEYFGAPNFLVLTFAGAEPSSGIVSMDYYSPVLFGALLPKAAASPGSAPAAKAAAEKSGAAREHAYSNADDHAAAKAPAAALAPPANGNGKSAPASTADSATASSAAVDAAPAFDDHSASNAPAAAPAASAPDAPAAAGADGNGKSAPANTPDSAAASSAPHPTAPAAPADYSGPSSGTIVWSGQLEKDQVITIEKDHPSIGSVRGALPGVAVQVDINTRDFAIVETPAPSNGWNRLAIRSRKKTRTEVSVSWRVIQ